MNWQMFAAIAGGAVSAIAIVTTVMKVVRWANKVGQLHPVIMEIATQFKNNSGSTLKDQISRVEDMGKNAVTTAAIAREASEIARQAVAHQTAIMETMRTEMIRQGIVRELQVPNVVVPPV